VYDIAPPAIQIMMDLALLTGQRQGDLVNLGWDQVDVLERVIHFQQSKTGRKLAVRISPALEAVLVRAKRRKPALPRLYVVRTRTGLPFSPEGMRTSWQRVMNQAMLSGLIKTRYTFHDLRAKSASDSRTIEQAYERLGHQSMGITRSIYDRGERVVEPLR
jgi:integrase